MWHFFNVFVIVAAMLLSQPSIAVAQGTYYFSNVGSLSFSNAAAAQNAWLAQSFMTGTNGVGYTLNSVELALDPATGSAAGFQVMLYHDADFHPGAFLGALTGNPNPSGGGYFFYNAAGMTLDSFTKYWLVINSQAPMSAGSYHPRLTSFFGSVAADNWSTDRYYSMSANGTTWLDSSVGVNLQFAITATPVPEPSTLALGLVCFCGFLLAGCRSQKAIV